jgi:hypothetical protein
MKLTTLLAVATAIGGVSAAPAFAQDTPAPAPAEPTPVERPWESGFYLGGGANLYFLDRDYASEGMPVTFEDQPSPGAWMLRLGYAFNQHVAVEIEAGIGAARQQFGADGVNAEGEIGINGPTGAHVVLSMPLGTSGYVLGKAGYVTAEIDREYFGFDYPDLEISGPSFGIGGGIRSGSWDYRMEYALMTGGDSGDGGVLGLFVFNHF